MTDRHLCDEYTEACFVATYEQPIPRDWEQCEQCEGWFETLEEGDVCEECAECCGGCTELFNRKWLSPSITIDDALMCDECLEEEKRENCEQCEGWGTLDNGKRCQQCAPQNPA